MTTNAPTRAVRKLLVWNSKGGVGKSPIAYNFALDHEHAIGTNESLYCYESLDSIEEAATVAVPMNVRFPDYPDDFPIIYDLAGFVDENSHSVASAVEACDLAIVPINNEWKALEHGVNSIHQIRRFDKPVLVIATKLKKTGREIFPKDEWTQSKAFKTIEETVHNANSPDIPVLPLKESAAFDTIFAMEQSIRQICETDPTRASNWKGVNAQMEAIYAFIDNMRVPLSINSRPGTYQLEQNNSVMSAH